MKIVFLHNELNAQGGIANVNIQLMASFLEDGHEVSFIAMRQRHNQEYVDYPKQVKIHLINENDEWCVPLYSQALSLIKKLHVLQGTKQIINRQLYDRKLHQDYEACQKLIEKIAPDLILCTHYECLQGIGDAYLSKTVHEYHTDFSQIKSHPSQQKLLLKYSGKLARFVWLSKGIMQEAIAFGLKPSAYIYNPLSFVSETKSDVALSKQVVFVGRLAPEKRIDLMIELFLKANAQLDNAYELKLYGIGELDEKTAQLIKENEKVQFMGSTNEPKLVYLQSALLLMTSCFEGLPLTVIEAAECGVPTIAMRFGSTIEEIIDQKKTGIIVEKDDKEAFVKNMAELLSDKKRLSQMGEEAKDFAQSFHADKIMQKWKELMKECVQ